MIQFQTWLSQILGYCQFVADIAGVRRAWVHSDYSRTSVTNFDELYEQVFDDLDSDVLEKELNTRLTNEPELREALMAFLQHLRAINSQQERGLKSGSMADLIESEEWGRLVEIAHRAMSCSSSKGLAG